MHFFSKDVKIGKAAFMKSQEEAELLADYMVSFLFVCNKSSFFLFLDQLIFFIMVPKA